MKDEVTDIRVGHQFDVMVLESYLRDVLPRFSGHLSVRQFAGGQSNPTFLLRTADRAFVLRKKPSGTLLPGAHQIEREYRIMSALADTAVPVPKMFAMCVDPSIIGTPFYVMEYVKGRVLRRASIPDASPADRAAIYDAMNETAAALHTFDWRSAGLSDFGKQNGYLSRQIRTWSRQYEATKTQPIPAMDRLVAWLPENVPVSDETTIAHGDFRLENLVFHPSENRVLAILDWELATLGHPLSDLAFNCMVYRLPPEMPALSGLAGLDLVSTGIPTEAAFVSAYCQRTNRKSIDDWDFFMAFAMFRTAAILQGVYARAVQNNASSPDALQVGKLAGPLAEIAWSQVAYRA
jgi:aminoglycoside phosphotransferase (APT) family kinase protein